ncbi:MAG: ABC transporter permease subunit [Clostridia bacterium]|nr:ABC transporter permease subunit [Clostridia bacterium]
MAKTNINKDILAPFGVRLKRDMKRNWSLYLLVLPLLTFYTLFCYKPMYGALIAFKEYQPRLGIMGSEWVGLKHFYDFITNPYFWRILRNTLTISFSALIFAFPAPIVLALLINELKGKWFPRIVQTISYLPHFISLVVVCSMVKEFTMQDGIINDLLAMFGVKRQTMLNNPNLFVPVYVLSEIWQGIGWSSIIYLAALTGIDQSLYEAAKIDGANRWKQTIYVTIPCIIPTVVTMLILRVGGLMNVGYEKIILLYNPVTYETADVISSFVYRKGILERGYSYSAAVGLFNSVINCILLFSTNRISRKLNNTSLW